MSNRNSTIGPKFGWSGVVLTATLVAGGTVYGGDCVLEWDPDFGLPGADSGIVFDFTSHDAGGGQLYASGNFTAIGGVAANRIARWDGSAWHALGGGLSNSECYAVASYGGDVFAAGYFDLAGGVPGTAKLARWDGSSWQSMGAQLELFSNQLWDLVPWNDGTGEALYIVGNYQNVGGVANASFVAKWDGASYSPLGGPIGGAVPLIIFTAYVWDDGHGEALYVGGRFLSIDGVPASRIAKWNGTQWTALGSGLGGSGVSPSANAMVAFDDGSGEALYVAGQSFTTAGGMPANRVARWDGTQWSAVGAGFADGITWGLQVFDEGNCRSALYATGTFTASGSTPIASIARWNGTDWEAVDGGANGSAYHSTVYDDGTGSALYVGGGYTSIGGVSANRVARLYSCVTIPGDVNGDGAVGFDDLLDVISFWGDCPPEGECPADLDCDGTVGFDDLLIVLANWS